jgi:hypothetical protein
MDDLYAFVGAPHRVAPTLDSREHHCFLIPTHATTRIILGSPRELPFVVLARTHQPEDCRSLRLHVIRMLLDFILDTFSPTFPLSLHPRTTGYL